MTTAILSSKGQITLPIAIRKALNLDTGDRIEFIEMEPGRYEMVIATLPVTAIKGMFSTSTIHKPISIDDMNLAIRKRANKTLL